MLCIFAGRPKSGGFNLSAGDVQHLVEGQGIACEHSQAVQYRKEGSFRQTRREKRILRGRPMNPQEEAYLNANPGLADILGIITESEMVSEVRDDTASRVHISPTLGNLSLADFPDNFSFGNGVTCGVQQPLRDGTIRLLSWIVIPLAQDLVLADPVKYEALRQIMELE